MKSESVAVIAFCTLIVIQVWAGISVWRYSWRMWHRQIAEAPFLIQLHYRLLRKLYGEELFRAGMVFRQRKPIRRICAVVGFAVSILLLVLSVFYATAIVNTIQTWPE